jgi:hypothetical protein
MLAHHRQLRLKHLSFFETQLFTDLSNTTFSPNNFFALLYGVPFAIGMSNVDFVWQRLDSLMGQREKKCTLN